MIARDRPPVRPSLLGHSCSPTGGKATQKNSWETKHHSTKALGFVSLDTPTPTRQRASFPKRNSGGLKRKLKN